MNIDCERCGAPASPTDWASRVFCERCESIAKTGERPSHELLFRIPTTGEDSAPELSALTEAVVDEEERISFPVIGLPPGPQIEPAPPPKKRRVGPALVLGVSAALFGASGAFALSTTGMGTIERIVAGAMTSEEGAASTRASRPDVARRGQTAAAAERSSTGEHEVDSAAHADLAGRAAESVGVREGAGLTGPADEAGASTSGISVASSDRGPASERTARRGARAATAHSTPSVEPEGDDAAERGQPSDAPAAALATRTGAAAPDRLRRRARDRRSRRRARTVAAAAHEPPTVDRAPPSDASSAMPDRDAIRAAFRGVQASSRCGDDALRGSVVTTRVVFRGDTGAVVHAEVTEAHVPPPVRSCIARAARAASVPPFDRDRFSVTYPFRI